MSPKCPPVAESPAYTSHALTRAVELVSAAYEEALRQHGMLASTVKAIHAHAYTNLARALTSDEEDTASPADEGAAG